MAQAPVRLEDGGSRLVIEGENIPFGAYQAIYHKLTKSVENKSKVYRDAYEVEFNDLRNLNYRIVQSIKQYAVQSSRCQISHAFRDDTAREHTSFEKFRLSDYEVRSCTKRVVYELDFLLVLPPEIPEADEIAQRYKLSISIDQDFIDKDDYNAPYFIRGLILGRNISLAIEFTDYAVAQALQSIVDGWVETLRVRELSGFHKFLSHYERFVRSYVPPLVEFIALIVISKLIFNSHSIRDALALISLAMRLHRRLALSPIT